VLKKILFGALPFAIAFPPTCVSARSGCSIFGSCLIAGSIVSIKNVPVFFDSQHGALIEDERCPYERARPFMIADETRATRSGKKLYEALVGGGVIGPLPKYIFVSGKARVTRNAAGALELRIISVSNFREKAIDPVERLDLIDAKKTCS
jgi:hypothetical protein